MLELRGGGAHRRCPCSCCCAGCVMLRRARRCARALAAVAPAGRARVGRGRRLRWLAAHGGRRVRDLSLRPLLVVALCAALAALALLRLAIARSVRARRDAARAPAVTLLLRPARAASALAGSTRSCCRAAIPPFTRLLSALALLVGGARCVRLALAAAARHAAQRSWLCAASASLLAPLRSARTSRAAQRQLRRASRSRPGRASCSRVAARCRAQAARVRRKRASARASSSREDARASTCATATCC